MNFELFPWSTMPNTIKIFLCFNSNIFVHLLIFDTPLKITIWMNYPFIFSSKISGMFYSIEPHLQIPMMIILVMLISNLIIVFIREICNNMLLSITTSNRSSILSSSYELIFILKLPRRFNLAFLSCWWCSTSFNTTLEGSINIKSFIITTICRHSNWSRTLW